MSENFHLSPGEIFITKHSNLHLAHLAFHYVIDINAATLAPNPTENMKQVLYMCYLWRVQHLVVDYSTMSDITVILKLLKSLVEANAWFDVQRNILKEKQQILVLQQSLSPKCYPPRNLILQLPSSSFMIRIYVPTEEQKNIIEILQTWTTSSTMI
eukprot:NODE_9335_length_600_cov_25.547170_g8701_i0.p1 GENE.NODE_9335_length_600_cov_25.547170_g8701_i0~~NODE_9335_length_600_cov_25.547170_g8701_i0.p1  ORF type:complete len:175 (+),score=26.04 NODE_9335_length_600_cov_25.547170_g8701_i0:58-525(+)